MVQRTIIAAARLILPTWVQSLIVKVWIPQKTRRARRAFELASAEPCWLEYEVLEELRGGYLLPRPYGYDQETLEKRGTGRANTMVKLLPDDEVNKTLELGSYDSMTNCALALRGKYAVALDVRFNPLDVRAKTAGVIFIQADATYLPFRDGSFDLVFSYAAFEHFHDPARVLAESTRVVRKGGYIYLLFGWLYMSPYGLHAYDHNSVPYCHFLFPMEVLKRFAEEKGASIPQDLNGWSASEYRNLWAQFSDRLLIERYHEGRSVPLGLDLIAKYPACFKSKTNCFDDLLVASIEVLFKRIG